MISELKRMLCTLCGTEIGSCALVRWLEPEATSGVQLGQPATGGSHEQRQSGETTRYGANLSDSECGRFRCWLNNSFDDANTGTARLLLDTGDHRDKLRFVGTSLMVHRPIHDDALYPGPPGSLIQSTLA